MNYLVKIQGREFQIKLEENGKQTVAVINSKSIPVQLEKIGQSQTYSALIGNRSLAADISCNETGYSIYYQGNHYDCQVEDERTARLKQSMIHPGRQFIERELKSPMPGLIVSVDVAPGQKVNAGAGLLVIEAMKMENEIKAPVTATVKEIKIQAGQAVETNQVLLLFE